MAKSGSGNLLLQHVEKLVLAVCLVILVVTVILYPMQQPTVPFDKQEMAPDKIDGYLVKLIDNLGKGQPAQTLQPEPDYLAILEGYKKPDLTGPRWAIVDLSTPGRWIPTENERKPGNRLKLQDLADLILKPGKPLVGVAAEFRATEPYSEVVAAHATSIYPVADLLERWQEAMKDSVLPAMVKIMDVRFQVQEAQEVLPNGTIVWGPARDVQGVFRPAKDKNGNDAEPPALPEATENNSKELQKAINDYFFNGWDKYKAEPDYWDVLVQYRDAEGIKQEWVSWRINLPWTELSAKAGAEPTGAVPTISPVRPSSRVIPGNNMTPPSSPDVPPGGIPPGSGGSTVRPGGPGGSPSGIGTKTTKTGNVHPRPVVPPPVLSGGLKPAPVPTPVPAWNLQMTTLGKAQVWVHDASLEYLKTYRYRAQLALLSPLYGHMGEVDPAEDAKKQNLDTPWSDWSDPVKPPPQADLFLTGYAQQMKKVTVTVFSRCQGQRVSHTFDVRVGDRIGEKVGDKIVKTIDVDVPDLQNPGKTVRKPCNFFTGYTLIDIDWDRTVIQNGLAVKTVEVVLMDEQGNLVIRNMALDTASSEYKALQAETAQMVKPPVVPVKPHTTTTRPSRVPGGGNKLPGPPIGHP
jgi:hypothetical protein